MENQKSRAYLKSLFRAGSIPNDGDFAKLIDSMQNLVDDKVERRNDGTRGDALCIGAGTNGVLMSFFSSLDQAGSNWTLQLGANNSLSLKTKNRSTPVITFDGAGQVGIGTETPQAMLDVRGNVQANNLSLNGELKVQGKAKVTVLEFAGLNTPIDAQLMQRLIAHLNAAPLKEAIPSSNSVSLPQMPQATLSIDVPPAMTAVAGNREGHVSESTPPTQTETPEALETVANAVWSECSVAAGRSWQNVAGPFVGMKVLVAMAWVMGHDNRSVTHVTAANVDGDPSTGAITYTHSYQGRPRGRIHFRWSGDKTGYVLQCCTGLSYDAGVQINLRLQELL